jgi:hypothetical protein
MYRLKLRYTLLSALFCVTILSCKIKVPPVADLDPIYELPTISLAEKEAVLFEGIVERHLNRCFRSSLSDVP